MKQFWTPLAKVFGLADQAQAPAKAQSAHAPAPPTEGSNWPLLFDALEQFARHHWIPAWQRHAEVSPNEVMSIRRIAIQANTQAADEQLQSWRNEGSQPQLLHWLVNGPWQHAQIRHCLDFSDFKELVLLPHVRDQAAPASQVNAYDDPNWVADANQNQALHLIVDFSWVPRPVPQAPPIDQPRHKAWMKIEDGQGSRLHELQGQVFILGQAKEMSWPDGRTLQLQHGQTLPWQGEEATYLAVEGLHVSGMHLAIRLQEFDIEYMDMGSANGTRDMADHEVLAHVWHRSMGDLELTLGGRASDTTTEAPRILCSLNPFRASVSVQKTPLRSNTPPAMSSTKPVSLRVELKGSNGWTHAQDLVALPFTIGRDPQCHCVIPLEFSKVSRRHLVIEAWDESTASVKIKDISTHGVQIESGGLSGDLTQGAWLTLGSQLVMGQSNHSPSVHIQFTNTSSNIV